MKKFEIQQSSQMYKSTPSYPPIDQEKFETQQSSKMYKSTPSYPPIDQEKFETQQSSQMYKSTSSYPPIDHYSDLQLPPPAEPTPSYPVHSPIYSDSQLPPPIEYHRPCPPLESPPTSRAEKYLFHNNIFRHHCHHLEAL